MSMLLLAVVAACLTASFGQPEQVQPTEKPLTKEEQACVSFDSGSELMKAEKNGSCNVICTFQSSYYDSVTSDQGNGISTQPLASLVGINGDSNTYLKTVTVGTNGLEPCGASQVCIRGVCTDQIKDLTTECQYIVGNMSIAVKGPNDCLIKCVQLVYNDPSNGMLVPYDADQVQMLYPTYQALPQMATRNIILPQGSSCGDGMRCSGQRCLDNSFFPEYNCPAKQ